MSRDPLDNLEPLVRRAVASVFASPARRRAMREELLSHLLASYEEELARPGARPAAALESAVRRLGDPDDLRRQFQSSVPLAERLVFRCLSKEFFMSRWIWFLAVFAFFFGPSIILPALARHKQQGVPWPVIAPALAIGLAITLAGLGTILYGVVRRLRRAA